LQNQRKQKQHIEANVSHSCPIHFYQNQNYSIVFFISPKKIKKITAQIQKYFNDRDILITREMTKLHEEYIRDEVKNLINIDISQKGEMTVVISENLNLQNRLQVIEESVKKKII